MADSARYAYAVTRGVDPSALSDGHGLVGGALEVVSGHGLDAVVSDVPLAEFSEDALKQNLESLSWLEKVARGHDDVVRLVTDLGPAAPLRLATIFHDDEAVRRRLGEWHDDIVQVLDRIDGRAEWSVKVLAPAAEPQEAETAEPTTGAEFLRRRKAQSDDRGQRAAEAVRVADEVHAVLSRAAVASRVLPAQDPQLTGLTGSMALNGAYLVEKVEQQQFEARLSEVRASHPDLRVEAAGPWPPYSFAVLEQP